MKAKEQAELLMMCGVLNDISEICKAGTFLSLSKLNRIGEHIKEVQFKVERIVDYKIENKNIWIISENTKEKVYQK